MTRIRRLALLSLLLLAGSVYVLWPKHYGQRGGLAGSRGPECACSGVPFGIPEMGSDSFTQLYCVGRVTCVDATLDAIARATDSAAAMMLAKEACHQGLHLARAAAERGRVKTLAVVLDAGCDPNGRSSGQPTPLMVAAERGDDACFSLLVARGADAHATDYESASVLWYALAGQQPHIISVARDLLAGPGWRLALRAALTRAASRGELSIVNTLLEDGSALSPGDLDDPLTWAIQYGHDDVAERLIGAGGDSFARGPCILVSAANFARRADLVDVLLRRGANPNQSCRGYYALSAAVRKNHLDKVRVLLTWGADPNALDEAGLTADDYARRAVRDDAGRPGTPQNRARSATIVEIAALVEAARGAGRGPADKSAQHSAR